MNKKLLTLAVAGAIVGGMGVAQADVTVYGKAAVSVDVVHVDKAGGFGADSNLTVANNSSRLGFKFSEDLGGSFFKKAVGQYEASVGIDGEQFVGMGGIFGGATRNSFLGLETAGGTMLTGIYDTPMKIVGRSVELFPEYVGDARNLTSTSSTGRGWDQRPTNAIVYMSPSLAGVTVSALYSADAGDGASLAPLNLQATSTDDNVQRLWSASVAYKGGPLYVGAAYEVHNIVPTGATQDDEAAYRIAASGTFGMFKVVALYQADEYAGGTNDANRSVYGLGGSVTLAEKHVVKAQYYKADSRDNVTTPANENGASMFAVGYDYKFSKKTTGYIAYAKTSNDTNGTFTVNGGGHGDTTSNTNLANDGYTDTINGADIGAVSVGMYMDF